MQIHESAENYLETILMLSKKLPVVRSVDIANELDFKKSSVGIAMKNWLISLGVDSSIAAEDACKMEHVISKESFEALKNHFGQF